MPEESTSKLWLAKVNALAEMNGMFWANREKTAVHAYFPQMVYLEELVSAYPHAHFILNVRDLRVFRLQNWDLFAYSWLPKA